MKKIKKIILVTILTLGICTLGTIAVFSSEKTAEVTPMGCTSLTLSTNDGTHLAGRTMDFSSFYGASAIAVNSDLTWKYTFSNSNTFTSKYKLAGIGTVDEDNNFMALGDGINQEGLTGMALYYSGYAQYAENPEKGKKGLNSALVLTYILSNCKNLTEVKNEFENNITIIKEKNILFDTETPLHFMFSDKSGKALIVEPDKEGFVTIYEENIGVLTNSPSYSWQETNLNNYIGVSPNQHKPIDMDGKELKAFSQGSGSFGLPGDYTPPSRFVRTAYQKKYTTKGETELDGVTQLFHILSSSNIPKGMVIIDEPESRDSKNNSQEIIYDYTLYTSAMSSETSRYYFFTYNNQQINCIDLKEQDFFHDNIRYYDIENQKQTVNVLNVSSHD